MEAIMVYHPIHQVLTAAMVAKNAGSFDYCKGCQAVGCAFETAARHSGAAGISEGAGGRTASGGQHSSTWHASGRGSPLFTFIPRGVSSIL